MIHMTILLVSRLTNLGTQKPDEMRLRPSVSVNHSISHFESHSLIYTTQTKIGLGYDTINEILYSINLSLYLCFKRNTSV